MTSNSDTAPRLHNLDYLRGIAAFGIMIYHYLTWAVGTFPAETFLGRVGLYGVAIFYVLSGLTLFHVYFNSMNEGRTSVRNFFVKRTFRIFPLLWIITITAIVVYRKMPNLIDLFLNLTGLFGFVKWDAYLTTGAWSIGNELVFYALFPLIVLAARNGKALLLTFTAALFVPYAYFAFVGLSPNESLVVQWSTYINPLNQAFLFIAGFAVGYFLRVRHVSQRIAWGAAVASITVFILWPAMGDTITLITGVNRMVFTLSCIVLCVAAYKITLSLPRILHAPLSTLGEASYSLYLIHPIVWGGVTFLLAPFLPPLARVVIAILLSLVASYICYRYFEKYFISLGTRVVKRRSRNSPADAQGRL